MAVKVMLAPAIAQRDANPPRAQPPSTVAEAKPKRRRTSVYDADGNEVFITLMCVKCRHIRPLSQFGLRRMADGAIRNQPWCRVCRSGASAQGPGRRRARAPAGVPDPSMTGGAAADDPSQVIEIVDSGALAAQVVAALHRGRG